jgi:hypothetical protein
LSRDSHTWYDNALRILSARVCSVLSNTIILNLKHQEKAHEHTYNIYVIPWLSGNYFSDWRYSWTLFWNLLRESFCWGFVRRTIRSVRVVGGVLPSVLRRRLARRMWSRQTNRNLCYAMLASKPVL